MALKVCATFARSLQKSLRDVHVRYIMEQSFVLE